MKALFLLLLIIGNLHFIAKKDRVAADKTKDTAKKEQPAAEKPKESSKTESAVEKPKDLPKKEPAVEKPKLKETTAQTVQEPQDTAIEAKDKEPVILLSRLKMIVLQNTTMFINEINEMKKEIENS